jgi:hypothetical protein
MIQKPDRENILAHVDTSEVRPSNKAKPDKKEKTQASGSI